MANSQELAELDHKYIWHPFTQMQEFVNREPRPLTIERGDGCYLFDKDGKKYLDGISSLWVNIHGHNRKEINDAIIEQVKKISHSTLLGLSNEKAIFLAKKLCDVAPSGLSHVFYSDDGSTAVEAAIKIAFQYWQQSGKPKKAKFLSFKGGYHGDTIGATSLGGIDLFHSKYGPLLFDAIKAPNAYCYRCEFSKHPDSCEMYCFDKCKELVEQSHQELAAVVIEPLVQGAAGMILWPDGFLSRLRELCNSFDVLLITDEVATGFGRTGSMFACQKEAVTPDIITVAKGITGGYLPLAATITTDKIYEAFLGSYNEYKTFFHGHSYSGNPVACAAAVASLEIFEKDSTIEKLKVKIEVLNTELQGLEELEYVGEIRQQGFMVGIELVKDKRTKEPFDPAKRTGYKVILKAREKGVILRPLGDVIVLMPPLSITEEELRFLVKAVKDSITEIQ